MTNPVSDDDGVIANLYDLTIEIGHHDDTVILQQIDYAGEVSRLSLHKWQVRMLAEQFELLSAAPRVSEGETIRMLRAQLADSGSAVRTLVRRMRVVQERTAHIQNWLCTHSDTQHADLTYEMDYTTGSMLICDEFCEELDHLLERFGSGARPAAAPALPAEPSAKACANPSGKASAKASVIPSGKGGAAGTGLLFGGDHG